MSFPRVALAAGDFYFFDGELEDLLKLLGLTWQYVG